MLKCSHCHGDALIQEELMNRGSFRHEVYTIVCPSCNGKGYITQQDIEDYYQSWRFSHENISTSAELGQ